MTRRIMICIKPEFPLSLFSSYLRLHIHFGYGRAGGVARRDGDAQQESRVFNAVATLLFLHFASQLSSYMIYHDPIMIVSTIKKLVRHNAHMVFEMVKCQEYVNSSHEMMNNLSSMHHITVLRNPFRFGAPSTQAL